nr:uncharacterized protein CTRU02_05675 [Colletotrichum truncatum]KAF6794118.1 hypothetical protein CTRU02_05675 [Colletotrichum truncatum]
MSASGVSPSQDEMSKETIGETRQTIDEASKQVELKLSSSSADDSPLLRDNQLAVAALSSLGTAIDKLLDSGHRTKLGLELANRAGPVYDVYRLKIIELEVEQRNIIRELRQHVSKSEAKLLALADKLRHPSGPPKRNWDERSDCATAGDTQDSE